MAAITQTTAPARSTGRALRRTLWGAQILLASFLLFASALPKFAGQQDAIETFAKIGWGDWFRYVTAVVEAAGAIGLVIPRLAGAAATALIGLMIGAALTQILVLEPAWALMPVVFGVIFALIGWQRREDTKALVHGLKR
ncbi:DoxX family protein [Actinomadura sp. 9N407]|uniref:DoxX family protein n=1 Tax=Actinomadura sp. 9N407 TaxID=3375154 RepID=UPI0037B77A30